MIYPLDGVTFGTVDFSQIWSVVAPMVTTFAPVLAAVVGLQIGLLAVQSIAGAAIERKSAAQDEAYWSVVDQQVRSAFDRDLEDHWADVESRGRDARDVEAVESSARHGGLDEFFDDWDVASSASSRFRSPDLIDDSGRGDGLGSSASIYDQVDALLAEPMPDRAVDRDAQMRSDWDEGH